MRAAFRKEIQVRYLNLSWRQTHDARLASYEISAALAEQRLAQAAADAEADADRKADHNNLAEVSIMILALCLWPETSDLSYPSQHHSATHFGIPATHLGMICHTFWHDPPYILA